RPPLTDAEMREILDEVGLEPGELALANRAAQPPAPVIPTPMAPILRPRERTFLGLPTQIHSQRELPAVPSPELARRVVRELEQNLGGVGLAEQFGTGMTWSNSEAQASIDRRPDGALLTIRRSFDKLARKRRRKGMMLGAFAGLMTGAICTDMIPSLFVALEPLLVFGGIAAGMILGHRAARMVHEQNMDEERRTLDWVGERIEVLVEAESPRALPPGGSN
ncbi:MAG: hypothetical protein KC457_32750, partial [Myxococcales bacterium]|nr:hypothetical protein [Myxococcales bacterium]